MSCINEVTTILKEEQRLQALTELELLNSQKVPIFEQATKIAAEFLEIPISIIGFMGKHQQWLKASVGLEKILPPDLNQLERDESFCSLVIENSQVISIRDTATHPVFANRSLVQQYGIRAYLGVPLLNSQGYCLGTLAVMDLAPRNFNDKEIKFLEMTARWAMSEFERQRLSEYLDFDNELDKLEIIPYSSKAKKRQLFKQIKSQIFSRLTQELRTPLTSIIGMTSVLSRGIYGALTNKQKEYLQIINDSGKYLLSLIDDILALKKLDEQGFQLQTSTVDLEMICQQVINALHQEINLREQEIHLFIEPNQRIWILDKIKVYQLLYHLIFSISHTALPGSNICLRISPKNDKLNILVWISHPWLNEEISLWNLCPCQVALLFLKELPKDELYQDVSNNIEKIESDLLSIEAELLKTIENETKPCLALLLSCLLVEMHGGEIKLQNLPTGGYRYHISLPVTTPAI